MEKKPLLATAFIVALLTSAVAGAQFNVGYATGTPADVKEVLVFLRDVVQIDTSKYEVRLTTNSTNYWPWFGGVAQTTGKYTLDSTGLVDSSGECGTSVLAVNFMFWDEEMVMCFFYEESRGPPLYSKQPVTDLSDAASGFLQRYQAYTGDEQLAQMRSVLDTVEVTSNATKTVDNLRLEVLVEDYQTVFTWGNTLNGTDYSRLKLAFQEGQFARFYDDRSFYRLGSSEVKISQEEAISIALKRVENFSYVYQGEVITDLIIDKELILAPTLDFLNGTNRFELYPCWIVDLPLAELYPGDIAFIKVLLWADSGEVVSAEALGYGFPYEEPSPTQTPTSSPIPEPEHFSTILITASIITVAVVGGVLLLYFKKRKH